MPNHRAKRVSDSKQIVPGRVVSKGQEEHEMHRQASKFFPWAAVPRAV